MAVKKKSKSRKRKITNNSSRKFMADVKAEAINEIRAKTHFKKGNQLAKGLDLTPAPESKPLRILTRHMVSEIMSQYIHATTAQLRKVTLSPTATMLERIVCRILLVSENKADPHRLEFILNRVIGKVKDEVEIKPVNPYDGWTDEQLITERERLAQTNLITLRKTIKAAEAEDIIQQTEIRDVQPEPTTTSESDSGLSLTTGTEPPVV